MALIRSAQQSDFAFQVDGGPADKLRVASFRGTEQISRPFRFELELVSLDGAIELKSMIGKPAVLTISGTQGKRFVHGVVLRLQQLGRLGRFTTYRADLVPEVFLLSYTARSRIHQDMTVPEAVEFVLKDQGIATDRFRFALQATYPKREYCVQYRESCFDFVSRLLEEEGIYYFFEHTKDGAVLVMADSNAATTPFDAKDATLAYVPPEGKVPEKQHVVDFRLAEELRSGKAFLKDFHWEKPTTDLSAFEQADAEVAFEVYEYPGGYFEPSEGKRLAKARLEELRATKIRGGATTTCRRLMAGYRFKLADHPRASFNDEYLVVGLEHEGSHPQVREEETRTGEEPVYKASLELIPSKTPFRPERVTERPFVRGIQTATVVGTTEKDVYMDKDGRAKVQFHWDREGKKDEKTTCWIRVGHGFAGPTHGIQFHPLVGDEVIVEFLEGDPDRPLITGSVYNASNKAPLDPEKRIQNVILTPYQHRLLFDDAEKRVTLQTGGSELLHLGDADKDPDFGNNVKLATKDGHFIQLAKGDKHKGLMLQSEAKHKIEVRDDPDPGLFLVDKNGTIYLHLDTQNKTIALINDEKGEIKVKVAGGKVLVAGAEITVDAEQKLTLKAGSEVKVESAKISIEAQSELSAKGSAKATVQGAQLELKGDATAKLSGGAQAEVSGGAMTSITGGIVKIN